MDIRLLIQENHIMRLLMKPYMDYKRKIAYEEYQNSADSLYLKTLKGIHNGKRCFIIGNGPSLRVEDLDRLSEEYTFGANRIYDLFSKTKWRPTFYMSTDYNVLRHSWHLLNNYDFGEMFLAVDKDFDLSRFKNKTTRIFQDTKFVVNKYNDLTAYVSEDVSKCFSVGYTVTFASIQLAIYMGFKEIYLLGMDFSFSSTRDKKGKLHVDNNIKDHFYEKKYVATVPFFYESNLHAYKVAKEYADSHDIKIVNVTRGGKLEVFERANFDEIIVR